MRMTAMSNWACNPLGSDVGSEEPGWDMIDYWNINNLAKN